MRRSKAIITSSEVGVSHDDQRRRSHAARNTALATPKLSATPRSGLRWRTPASLDHLISAQHYRWRYRKTERRGGLAVYDHLELGRQLHREIARLRAAQDAIHIGGSTT